MTEQRTTSSTGGQKGVKLARFDLIPTGPLKALAEHYGRGAAKYANHQWRQGYEWSKSFAAMCRHQNAFWAGEDYDVCPADDEGCAFETAEGEPFEPFWTEHGRGCYNHTTSHHLAAVAWHAFCLLEFAVEHPEHDDRYVSERIEVAANGQAMIQDDVEAVVWGEPILPTEQSREVALAESEAILAALEHPLARPTSRGLTYGVPVEDLRI